VGIQKVSGLSPEDFHDGLSTKEAEAVKKMSSRGLICFVALEEGKAVGAMWCAVGKFCVKALRLTLDLAGDEVFVAWIYVLPRYRRSSVPPALAEAALSDFKERGYRRAIGIINLNNTSSLKLCRNIGFKDTKQLGSSRVLLYRMRPKEVTGPQRPQVAAQPSTLDSPYHEMGSRSSHPVRVPLNPRPPLTSFLNLSPHRGLPEPFNTTSRFYLYSYGRNAVWNAMKVLNLSSKDNLLFPSYHCGSELDPILKYGVGVRFYRINQAMEIDFDSLIKTVDRDTKAIFVTHYLGFPQDLHQLLSICKRYNLFLIEDCAHTLYGRFEGRYLGTWGDVGIFSMRKLLPILNGGALIVNNPALADPEEQTPLYLSENFVNLGCLIRRSIRYWGIIKLLASFNLSPLGYSIEGEKQRMPQGQIPEGIEFQVERRNWRMSGLSRRIMEHIDHQRVLKKRCENFLFLMNELYRFRKIQCLFKELPEGVCPWIFPILVKDRLAMAHDLLSQGIAVGVFWHRFHTKVPWESFPEAVFLKNHVMALPIHQDLEIIHLRYIVEALARWDRRP
jgi:dTDP-4-amino-4,6-dideoxygalactose transaminase/GNAT superfamily N-acetyltransferase